MWSTKRSRNPPGSRVRRFDWIDELLAPIPVTA
jgi:hypothetical protein